MSDLRKLPPPGGVGRPAYDGGVPLLRPRRAHVHLTVPAVAPRDADLVVHEQDTRGVLAADCTLREPRDSYRQLVRALLAQRPLQPGSVVVREGRRLRVYAIVHELEREPSWQEAWIEAALRGVLRIARERRVRALVMPPLGAVHGRYAPEAFLALLERVAREEPTPTLAHLWLAADPPKLAALRAALVGRPAQEAL